MPGTLHIIRRNVANGPTLYQVNYTQDSRTYAKVLESEALLREFLFQNLALSSRAIDSIWDQLRTGGAHVEGLAISYNEANANGMIEAPSDF